MRCLLTGYALPFNRRHHRVGHLFQTRCQSIVVEEATHIREVLRSIHLNPRRARLVVRSVTQLGLSFDEAASHLAVFTSGMANAVAPAERE